MKKIYLASPFFNDGENLFVALAEHILRDRGFDVFSPRENEIRKGAEVGTSAWACETFNRDVQAIDESDIVVMLYHGNYSDSGTAWECGYAFATNKPVIAIHLWADEVSNLMVHCSTLANITIEELETYDFDNLPEIEYTGDMT